MDQYSPLNAHPYLVATIILFLLLLYFSLLPSGIYTHFPRVGDTFLDRRPVHILIQEGYNKIAKVNSRPFVVKWWAKDYIILPPKNILDLRTATWTHLSFFQNINDALFLGHTVGELYTAPAAERMVDVVKRGLNPKLPNITQPMLDEIDHALMQQLGHFKGWKEVTATPFFSNIAHRLATRILIGEELCRNEEFLKLSQGFLNSIFVTALVIVKLPLGPFRKLVAWPLSCMHILKKERCARILLPLVKSRLAARKGEHTKKLDAIEWTLDFPSAKEQRNTPEHITDELLYGLWAGSSAPGGMLTEIMYQLLLSQQYLEPLREEAERAVRQYGWSEKMLNELHLLDSFIREVNRLYPTGSVTCSRTVVGAPFEFSDGLTLPIGTRFGFPIKAMQSDPDIFADPMTFNGFRFAHQAASYSSDTGHEAENSRRALLSATAMGTTNLAWGYGNHICPGRFFAVREIKLVFTKLLLEFDMKWEREKKDGRPSPVHVEGQFIPNLSQKMFLRRRKGVDY